MNEELLDIVTGVTDNDAFRDTSKTVEVKASKTSHHNKTGSSGASIFW